MSGNILEKSCESPAGLAIRNNRIGFCRAIIRRALQSRSPRMRALR